MKRMIGLTALAVSLVVVSGCGDKEPPTCSGVPELAEQQQGVCAGTMQVCVGTDWVDPVYSEVVENFQASEASCDGLDNDCDGTVDDGVGFTYTIDSDGDGFGDINVSEIVNSCESTAPTGFATNASDCNDGEANINPDADETCDGTDNDCDGMIDGGECGPHASCSDAFGDAECECDPGYTGDGLVCDAEGWLMLAAGRQFSCGIDDGRLYCWGNGSDGSLGSGNFDSTHIPQQVGTSNNWSWITAGSGHACGIDTGALYCWGENELGGSGGFGLLGLGATYDGSTVLPSPMPVGSDTDWDMVSAGRSFSCGIRAGELHCWGRGVLGRLGTGDATDHDVPTRVGTMSDWSWVSAGGHGTGCGLRGGALYCWGHNVLGGSQNPAPNYGLLGQGASYDGTDFVTSPIRVGSATTWEDVTVAGRSVCAINAGALYCWGRNAFGQVGVGDLVDYDTPQQVGSFTDWIDVHGDDWAVICALRATGGLYCWGGDDGLGELGLGDDLTGYAACDDGGRYCDEPTMVGVSTDWRSLEVGGIHGLAVSAGDLYCWGTNGDGECGYDSTINDITYDPTMIPAP